ncbi:unnamed protein product [Aphanomyces euteiches]|nr:hypothetical protein AeRB84_015349 [Aphanomyces euteiches]
MMRCHEIVSRLTTGATNFSSHCLAALAALVFAAVSSSVADACALRVATVAAMNHVHDMPLTRESRDPSEWFAGSPRGRNLLKQEMPAMKEAKKTVKLKRVKRTRRIRRVNRTRRIVRKSKKAKSSPVARLLKEDLDMQSASDAVPQAKPKRVKAKSAKSKKTNTARKVKKVKKIKRMQRVKRVKWVKRTKKSKKV